LWLSSRTPASHLMIARLRPEITPAQAQAASQVLFRQLAGERPDAIPWIEQMRMEIVPAGRGLSQLRAQYERPLLALGALVTLVLLITCTNIGTLLMVRNNARRRELAVRASLGAGRSRLVLQHLLESTVLATLGGLVALIVARWGVSALLSMLPLAAVPEGLTFQIDGRILAFTAGMTLFAAVLFGLAPAWRAGRVNLADALRSSQGTTATRSSRRLGRVLVAFQVGLSVLLLIGTGLFVQTLRNLDRLNVGFNADQLLQVVLDSNAGGYREPGQVGQLYTRLLERVAAIPGVRSVTGARMPLMHGIMSRTSFRSLGPGRDLPPGDSWDSIEVGPSFFETMNIPLLRGRLFTRTDFDREQTTIIVNESFARHYFPGADPTTAAIGEAIVGVVGDAKIAGVRREAGPIMFFMARAADANRLDALQVRITGEADAVARAIQAEISRVDPRLFVGISTMRQEIDRSIATERMVAATSAFFSVLALLLVSIGIFGVASSNLVQRTSELAIRMALGAGRWKVICESLRDTLLVFAAGMAGGIIAAVVAVRLTATFLSDLLFGLSAADAANIAGAVALMVLVALAACALPARRATRIDPLAAIRHE
ncbi:MAG TPA: FtsX-like permease family protein, partial [Vicinamibacterales bacterium]|nr:FtsX-like permease family protein [Vicinamibacterales bacterium]